MTDILVVDDNTENLELLKALFEGHGYTVVLARNGREALQCAQQQTPAVAISDILMPEMDGFSLCRKWMDAPNLNAVPFVFYTATYTDPEDEKFALSLGATQFIIKPQEPEPFLEMIRNVMATFERGGLEVPQDGPPEDTEYLREYNAALIRKLEDKLEQLADSDARLTSAVDAGRMGIWEWTPATDVLRTWNVVNLFGLDPGHELNCSGDFYALIHPADLPRVERAVNDALTGQNPDYEVAFRLAHDETRWFRGRGFVTRGKDREPVRMAGATIDITDQWRADVELRESRDALRRLAHRLVSVREEEHRAMAREVHDVLGQNLVALRLEVEAFAKTVQPTPETEARKRDLTTLIDASSKTAQHLSARLRPAALDALGLESALIQETREHERRGHLEIQLDVDEAVESLPTELKLALYRIAQEACTNIVRHARAKHVEIRVTLDAGIATLTVRDDGVGIPQEHVGQFSSLGLLGMFERAQALGGDVSIASLTEGGTLVRASIPTRDRAP